MGISYDTLAAVYEFLVPEPMLTPQGAAGAFGGLVDLPPAARVLDCACGTGTLAVGLALQGHLVTASDASPRMVERTRALAAEHGVQVATAVRRWEDLASDVAFDAVFCAGNSITHAHGRAGRVAALSAMRDVLAPDGTLVLTSRNWEQVRTSAPRLEIVPELIERGGLRGLVVRTWELGEDWEEEHAMEVAVVLVDTDGEGEVEVHRERLTFFPFGRDMLRDDVATAGLVPRQDTWRPEAERWLLTAGRAS